MTPPTLEACSRAVPASCAMRVKIENDCRVFLRAMAKIKQGMVLGVDKNIYVEPTIWTIEWARNFYKYPVTRSNQFLAYNKETAYRGLGF